MNRTILVVDDDIDMQQMISGILEDEGYAVVVAEDGLAALEKLEGITPSAILLDITMPRMNGYQFAEAATERGLRPGIPIMVLTADGRAREKAAHIGAESYLTKPFALLELIAAVERILASR